MVFPEATQSLEGPEDSPSSSVLIQNKLGQNLLLGVQHISLPSLGKTSASSIDQGVLPSVGGGKLLHSDMPVKLIGNAD